MSGARAEVTRYTRSTKPPKIGRRRISWPPAPSRSRQATTLRPTHLSRASNDVRPTDRSVEAHRPFTEYSGCLRYLGLCLGPHGTAVPGRRASGDTRREIRSMRMPSQARTYAPLESTLQITRLARCYKMASAGQRSRSLFGILGGRRKAEIPWTRSTPWTSWTRRQPASRGCRNQSLVRRFTAPCAGRVSQSTRSS